MAILLMVLHLFVNENGSGMIGLKFVASKWWELFKTETSFRRKFCLAFYTVMILFQTLLNRNFWMNPLSGIMGGGGLTGVNGNFTTESIENLILFISFVVLLLWALQGKLFIEKFQFGRVIW